MTSVPAWYVEALAHPPRIDVLQVEGARIAVRRWGATDLPAIILIHGGAAHAAWWDHLAPLLGHYQVLAIDLSGHGDSDWRDQYRMAVWLAEVIALVRSSWVAGKPLVVGHSMGGFVTYLAARHHGTELAGAVMVDSQFPRPEAAAGLRQRRAHARHLHPDRATILGRFRTLPKSEPKSPFTIGHVASESVIEIDGGWTWKFDPRFFEHDWIGLDDLVPITDCPAVIVRGDAGMMSVADAAATSRALELTTAPITLADCGHHVPLDQPAALAAVIQALASIWLPHDPRTIQSFTSLPTAQAPFRAHHQGAP